jgi:hypothetical protein
MDVSKEGKGPLVGSKAEQCRRLKSSPFSPSVNFSTKTKFWSRADSRDCAAAIRAASLVQFKLIRFDFFDARAQALSAEELESHVDAASAICFTSESSRANAATLSSNATPAPAPVSGSSPAQVMDRSTAPSGPLPASSNTNPPGKFQILVDKNVLIHQLAVLIHHLQTLIW